MYQAIRDREGGCVLVHGEPGSGRSAFAQYSLEFYRYEGWFAILLTGNATQASIRRCLAEELLMYVGDKATLLSRFAEDAQLAFLASLIAEELGSDEVDARLAVFGRTQPWMNDAETKFHKELWPKVGREQIERLRQVLDSGNGNVQRTDLAWLRAVAGCTKWLGFKGIALVLDLPAGSITTKRQLRVRLEPWRDAGILVVLCLPSDDFMQCGGPSLDLEDYYLGWRENESLQKLLGHRYNKVLKTKRKLRSHFDSDEALKLFIDVTPHTPRQAGRLWQQLLKIKPSDKAGRYSSNDVQEAMNMLKGAIHGTSRGSGR